MSALVAADKKAPESDCASRYVKKSREDGYAEERNVRDHSIDRHAAGNLATERLLRSSEPPSLFKINPPDDIHEEEADQLAELATQASEGNRHRKPKNVSHKSNPVPSFSSFSEAELILSSGHALDAAHCEHFEERLGADLSHVRIHTDSEAAATADALDAEAFTIGSQIVFGTNRYQANTSAGQRLLGHELAHVIQQTAGPTNAFRSLPVRTHTAVIQRQPLPGTGVAGTDSIGFIEEQLKLRFSSPEDPRLIVRVQRLQEAFSRLSFSESSRLLDRLRDPADELARNFQRLAPSSRNRLQAILLKTLPAEIEGKTLGKVSSAATLFQLPLIAKMEVTPSTAEAGMFAGYGTFAEARDAVIRLPTISAVVLDRKFGRFRAFDTGFPTIRGVPNLRVTVMEPGDDYELKGWVNVEDEEVESPDRLDRIRKARQLVDDYVKTYGNDFLIPTVTGGVKPVNPSQATALKTIKDTYRELFEEALPFARGQFDFAFEFHPTNLAGEQRQLTTAQPGKTNIDIQDIFAHGHQKVLDPLEDIYYPGAHGRASIKDELSDTSPVSPEPYIVLSRGSLNEEPLETRRVFLHERAHLSHAQRAIQLIEQWKDEGGTGTFKAWIENEVSSQRVSVIDAILTVERLDQPVGTLAYNTETLAEVEGFISVYHAIPLGKNLALERLTVLARMWLRSDSAVQDLSIRKLQHYYSRMLDKTYRDAFLKYVTDLWQTAFTNSDPLAEFYLKLTEFYAIGD